MLPPNQKRTGKKGAAGAEDLGIWGRAVAILRSAPEPSLGGGAEAGSQLLRLRTGGAEPRRGAGFSLGERGGCVGGEWERGVGVLFSSLFCGGGGGGGGLR